MTQPGWYPDPAGRPGLMRYWDGQRWSQEVVDAQGRPVEDQPRGRRGGAIWLLPLVALLVIGLVIWGFQRGGGDGATEDTNSATPTVSGWDETSTPPPPPTPSEPPSSPSPTGGSMRPCPVLQNERASHPDDGRLHGGGLSVDVPQGFTPTTPDFGRFMTDHYAARKIHGKPGANGRLWFNIASVGKVPRKDFINAKSAGALIIQCHTSSGNFTGKTGGEVITDEAVTVSGKPGWRHAEKVTSSTAPGGHVITQITAVDLGDPEWIAIFWIGWVADATDAEGALRAIEPSLKVD